ncbi:TetR family transcriptional regulator [Amycolatopsis mediterranei S699]|uniref:TetR family transcriptional regulator n=2 Tax=Amycolatopsis mediterranei TaxID=33910 RepID=A0A0H3DGE4_AMYMU|nr:TetR/AcrR family transcriptional regulator [Amycolatopsis mediterranei]ADJ49970.1 TetR family transcriptional regulator [Amycolatopsis mediterranei U32]AEK46963.1 TetR family transcriptional regulator [Amycolatopsis mediterranei S699]AFO81678.1 TetR family transcriptional regulator [Amycolatopsis mediterranei S699]AGT88807.1 TetR family transcriptional regulator [Amycolatopsis mediterranei RB]KDO07782.1 TetR family transcriptional regulator [Amycolatopsis mediterranei]
MGTRQRLITTAAELLAVEGVGAVTLRGIAKAAGVSHGAPLRHFSGRAELLSAVATRGYADLLARRKTLPETSPRERLTAACHSYLDFALTNPAMFELMFRRDLVDPDDPALSAAASAVFDTFAVLVAAVPTPLARSGADLRLVAASLWAALHGLAQLWLWGGLAGASFAPSPEAALAVTLDAYLDTPTRSTRPNT